MGRVSFSLSFKCESSINIAGWIALSWESHLFSQIPGGGPGGGFRPQYSPAMLSTPNRRAGEDVPMSWNGGKSWRNSLTSLVIKLLIESITGRMEIQLYDLLLYTKRLCSRMTTLESMFGDFMSKKWSGFDFHFPCLRFSRDLTAWDIRINLWTTWNRSKPPG